MKAFAKFEQVGLGLLLLDPEGSLSAPNSVLSAGFVELSQVFDEAAIRAQFPAISWENFGLTPAQWFYSFYSFWLDHAGQVCRMEGLDETGQPINPIPITKPMFQIAENGQVTGILPPFTAQAAEPVSVLFGSVKLILTRQGILGTVSQAIKSIADPQVRSQAIAAWNRAAMEPLIP